MERREMERKIEGLVIGLQDWEHDLILEDEDDVCDRVIENFDGDMLICDAISEVANNSVSIYNWELWENAPKIEEYIAEYVFQCGIDEKNFDLIEFFRNGEYEYYSSMLYKFSYNICYNYVANEVNEMLENGEFLTLIKNTIEGDEERSLEEKEFEEIVDYIAQEINIEEIINNIATNGDNCNRFYDLIQELEENLENTILDLYGELCSMKENKKIKTMSDDEVKVEIYKKIYSALKNYDGYTVTENFANLLDDFLPTGFYCEYKYSKTWFKTIQVFSDDRENFKTGIIILCSEFYNHYDGEYHHERFFELNPALKKYISEEK